MKANQITAISAVVIAIGVVYTIVNSKIQDQLQQQKTIELQQKQKLNTANRFCTEVSMNGTYRLAKQSGKNEDAKEFLLNCMGLNGFWNVECTSYGECKLKDQ